MTAPKETPMMKQWAHCKSQAQDALVLFRLGDFYEAFHDDAVAASQALDLTLTKRQDVPMCGIPWHASESYIDKLLAKGFSVAIAEQVSSEDAASGKGLMDRKLVRIITPSTTMKGSLLQESSHTLLCCIAKKDVQFSLAFVDISTALFFIVEAQGEEALFLELSRHMPKEIIHALPPQSPIIENVFTRLSIPSKTIPSWFFDYTQARTYLLHHFSVANLLCFGIDDKPLCIASAGALLRYLKDVLLHPICHLQTLSYQVEQKYMLLDRSTIINLDIFENSSSPAYSLYATLCENKTPMGFRLLRQFLANPLIRIEEIQERQEAVSSFLHFIADHPSDYEKAQNELSLIKDIQRLILRIQTGYVGPRDLAYLASCLSHIKPLQEALKSVSSPNLQSHIESLCGLETLIEKIQTTLSDDPPLRIGDGNVIREKVSEELDTLRKIHTNSHQWLAEYQTKLRETYKVKTLKVGFTRAFGYYIEVSRGQASFLPESFARRQTLTNAERFISEELKSFEESVLTAEKKIEGLETALFEELKNHVLLYVEKILKIASSVALLDLFLGFAVTAQKGKYICPKMVEEPILEILDGKHPIAEKHTSHFIPNSVTLHAKGPSLALLTGPNMAGKSTYIRQIALLVIMAQIGSFIPAKKATIGIVDRVFSRIGASDDLASKQSTFMVEMSETASILHQATPRSLIILDEIGRGTSTYDGISIAWAVCEYLLRFPKENPRTLFATHYFELTELEKIFPSVINMTVAISEQPSGIRFLYKIVSGKTDKSYGIHVAKLAGLPKKVLERSEEVLLKFEAKKQKKTPLATQIELFDIPTKKVSEELICYDFIKQLDLSSLSPIDCFMKLVQFKNSLY